MAPPRGPRGGEKRKGQAQNRDPDRAPDDRRDEQSRASRWHDGASRDRGRGSQGPGDDRGNPNSPLSATPKSPVALLSRMVGKALNIVKPGHRDPDSVNSKSNHKPAGGRTARAEKPNKNRRRNPSPKPAGQSYPSAVSGAIAGQVSPLESIRPQPRQGSPMPPRDLPRKTPESSARIHRFDSPAQNAPPSKGLAKTALAKPITSNTTWTKTARPTITPAVPTTQITTPDVSYQPPTLVGAANNPFTAPSTELSRIMVDLRARIKSRPANQKKPQNETAEPSLRPGRTAVGRIEKAETKNHRQSTVNLFVDKLKEEVTNRAEQQSHASINLDSVARSNALSNPPASLMNPGSIGTLLEKPQRPTSSTAIGPRGPISQIQGASQATDPTPKLAPLILEPWRRDPASLDVTMYRKKMADLYQKSNNFPGDVPKLKISRAQERKDAIKDHKISDPERRTTLAEAITVVGTCPGLCPEFERVERIAQMMYEGPETTTHPSWEKKIPLEYRMVKRFRRSAAGYDEQLPSDIRPPLVLQQTLNYLLDDLVAVTVPLTTDVHLFIWDRTRGIRNDFSIQQVKDVEDVKIAMDVYERIARFHILSLHHFSGNGDPTPGFDHRQELEQLINTLTTLRYYYNDYQGRVTSPNEAEFRSYFILWEILGRKPDIEEVVQSCKPLYKDPLIQIALQLRATALTNTAKQGPWLDEKKQKTALIAQMNSERWWRAIISDDCPFNLACFAEIYFHYIRALGLEAIWRVYRAKRPGRHPVHEWSMSDLRPALGFDDESQVIKFIEDHGFKTVKMDSGELFLDMSALPKSHRFLEDKNPSRRQAKSLTMVEPKRMGRSIYDLIHCSSAIEVQSPDSNAVKLPSSPGLFISDEETKKTPTEPKAATDWAKPTPSGVFTSVDPLTSDLLLTAPPDWNPFVGRDPSRPKRKVPTGEEVSVNLLDPETGDSLTLEDIDWRANVDLLGTYDSLSEEEKRALESDEQLQAMMDAIANDISAKGASLSQNNSPSNTKPFSQTKTGNPAREILGTATHPGMASQPANPTTTSAWNSKSSSTIASFGNPGFMANTQPITSSFGNPAINSAKFQSADILGRPSLANPQPQATPLVTSLSSSIPNASPFSQSSVLERSSLAAKPSYPTNSAQLKRPIGAETAFNSTGLTANTSLLRNLPAATSSSKHTFSPQPVFGRPSPVSDPPAENPYATDKDAANKIKAVFQQGLARDPSKKPVAKPSTIFSKNIELNSPISQPSNLPGPSGQSGYPVSSGTGHSIVFDDTPISAKELEDIKRSLLQSSGGHPIELSNAPGQSIVFDETPISAKELEDIKRSMLQSSGGQPIELSNAPGQSIVFDERPPVSAEEIEDIKQTILESSGERLRELSSTSSSQGQPTASPFQPTKPKEQAFQSFFPKSGSEKRAFGAAQSKGQNFSVDESSTGPKLSEEWLQNASRPKDSISTSSTFSTQASSFQPKLKESLFSFPPVAKPDEAPDHTKTLEDARRAIQAQNPGRSINGPSEELKLKGQDSSPQLGRDVSNVAANALSTLTPSPIGRGSSATSPVHSPPIVRSKPGPASTAKSPSFTFVTSSGDISNSANSVKQNDTSPIPSPSDFTNTTNANSYSTTLDHLANFLMSGENGLMEHFSNFTMDDVIKSAMRQVDDERSWKEAGEARMLLLATKYGKKWRKLAWGRSLRRKRNLLKDSPHIRELMQKRPIVSEDILDSISNPKQCHSDADLLTKSGRSSTTERGTGILPPPPSHLGKRKSLPSSLGTPPKKQRVGERVEDGAAKRKESQHKRSKTMTLLPPGKGVHLSYSELRDMAASGPPVKADTTQTDYFLLKSYGIDPDTTIIPKTGRKRYLEMLEDKYDKENMIAKRRKPSPLESEPHSPRTPSSRVSPKTAPKATPGLPTSTPEPPAWAAFTPREGLSEHDALMTEARYISKVMAESTTWYQEATQFVGNTPQLKRSYTSQTPETAKEKALREFQRTPSRTEQRLMKSTGVSKFSLYPKVTSKDRLSTTPKGTPKQGTSADDAIELRAHH